MRSVLTIAASVVMTVASGRLAVAQEKPAPIVEFVIGQSGFVDDVWDGFTTVGGGVRWFITPRTAIGPELAYMRGTFAARDASNVSVTVNVTLDLVSDDRHRRAVPYVVGSGGYLRQRTVVGQGPGIPGLVPYVSSEGTASGGIGLRVALNRRLFVAPEFRAGWEPETRIGVIVGLRTR